MAPELATLAWAAGGPDAKVRPMLMLAAFLDESHDKKRERAYAIAGLLSPVHSWDLFWLAWNRVLEEHGITEFHAADCENGQGPIFGRLSSEKRTTIQRDLIELIADPKFQLVGFAVAIDLAAYNVLRPEMEKFRFTTRRSPISGSLCDPYFTAFQHGVEMIADYPTVKRLPPEEVITFIFDQNHEYQGRAEPLYHQLRITPHLSYSARLGGCGFLDRRKVKPLQAADLLAYESFRHMSDAILGGRPQRWQASRLAERLGSFVEYRREHLLNLIDGIREACEREEREEQEAAERRRQNRRP
jgi:hypothetical protein